MDSILLIIFPILGIILIRMWFIDNWDITKEDTFIILYNDRKQMTKLLTFLQGKKTTIGTILGFVITYCLTKGYIDNDLAIMLSGILVALGLGANVSTAKMVK